MFQGSTVSCGEWASRVSQLLAATSPRALAGKHASDDRFKVIRMTSDMAKSVEQHLTTDKLEHMLQSAVIEVTS